MVFCADIPLPAGPRRLVNVSAASIMEGVNELWRTFGPRANAPAMFAVGRGLRVLRRLSKLLRFVLLMVAAWHPAAAEAPRRRVVRAPRARTPHRVRPPVFRVGRGWGVSIVDPDAPRPQPPAFARALRDPLRTLLRKLDALSSALGDPAPIVRRLARRLRRDIIVVGWVPPKRPPPTDRREYWDDLIEMRVEVAFTLSEFRRKWRDTS